MKRMIKALCIVMFFQNIITMESLCKKFFSLTFFQKNNNPLINEKKLKYYRDFPLEGRHFMYVLKCLQRKYALPFDLMKIILKKLITDEDFFAAMDNHLYYDQAYQRNFSLLYYLISCNLFQQESIEAIKKIFTTKEHIPAKPINALIKKKFFIPLFAPYRSGNFSKIQKSIARCDLQSLEKICNQPCIPHNALWNYAFLAASYFKRGKKKKEKSFEIMRQTIVKHIDPIQNFDPHNPYQSKPVYKSQSLAKWLLLKTHSMCFAKNPPLDLTNAKKKIYHLKFFEGALVYYGDIIIIPHLSMDQLQYKIITDTL